MKNLTKTGVFIAWFFALILLSVSISAETITDESDDVWVYELGGSGMTYHQYSGSRNNVDITSVSCEISDSTVTASLTVEGDIQNDMYHTYFIYLENPSGQYYATYSAGSGMWIGTDKYGGEMGQLTDPISGNTFTAIFEISHPEDSFNPYGVASESVDATEAYYDYAPDVFAPYYEASSDDESDPSEDDTGDDDTDDTDDADTDNGDDNSETNSAADNGPGENDRDSDANGTPGFEPFALIAAFAAVVLLIKKRN